MQTAITQSNPTPATVDMDILEMEHTVMVNTIYNIYTCTRVMCVYTLNRSLHLQ